MVSTMGKITYRGALTNHYSIVFDHGQTANDDHPTIEVFA